MSWLKKLLPKVNASGKKGVPEGVWAKCGACQASLYRLELEKNQYVCPKCGHHIRISARKRLSLFLDEGSCISLAEHVVAKDHLKFKDSKKYKDRLSAAQKKTGETEALLVMQGTLKSSPLVVACFEFAFIGGSMSAAVGERFVIAVEAAIEQGLPFVCFSASGGARMQESVFSLFQMSKTSAALAKLAKAKLPFISVLLDPTMGGVSASLATLGDVIIAEPNALIGFSGPRVIEQTIRETLPEGFQRSEFLLEHGAIDMIVKRGDLRDTISGILGFLSKSDKTD